MKGRPMKYKDGHKFEIVIEPILKHMLDLHERASNEGYDVNSRYVPQSELVVGLLEEGLQRIRGRDKGVAVMRNLRGINGKPSPPWIFRQTLLPKTLIEEIDKVAILRGVKRQEMIRHLLWLGLSGWIG